MIFLALAASAHAGLLDSLTVGDRQVAICRQTSAPAEATHDYVGAAGVWEACVAEAKRTANTEALPALEDQLALIRARAAAAAWRTTDPNRYALSVLPVAANQRHTGWIGTDVAEIFRAWMQTEAGKGRLEQLRTVTVTWEGVAEGQAETARRATELLRRHAEDLGLKWAQPGQPEVDTIVFASLFVGDAQALTVTKAGALPRAQARIVVDRVRFRSLDATAAGFSGGAVAEAAEPETAREEALSAACDHVADRVLMEVLRMVFR